MVSAEHITGESLPVLSRAGDEVAAGSLNRDGLLVVQALRPAAESTPARIAQLTLDAQASGGGVWLGGRGRRSGRAGGQAARVCVATHLVLPAQRA